MARRFAVHRASRRRTGCPLSWNSATRAVSIRSWRTAAVSVTTSSSRRRQVSQPQRKNYSFSRPSFEPEWIGSAPTDPAASSRLRNLALQARSYLDGDRRRFIHVIDCGVSDNLGLRGSTDSVVVYAGASHRVAPCKRRAGSRSLSLMPISYSTKRNGK